MILIKELQKNAIFFYFKKDFIHFLIENVVDRDIVIKYLKYHYADGSTNGKSNNRISVDEYKKYHENDINEINEVFNNENILLKAIDKFVIRGNNSKYDIDAIIYGEVNDFLWIMA